jgi:hypothetical protein
VDWEAYLAWLTSESRPHAERLAKDYGQEAANRLARYHLIRSLDELAKALEEDRRALPH